MLVIMNPFHGPTASRAEFASYYVLLALQIPVHDVGDHTGGMAVKLDGTREPRHPPGSTAIFAGSIANGSAALTAS